MTLTDCHCYDFDGDITRGGQPPSSLCRYNLTSDSSFLCSRQSAMTVDFPLNATPVSIVPKLKWNRPSFIQRIHGEAAQLVQNITELTDFIAKCKEGKIENINPQYLDLMIRQRAVMETHLGILHDRLELLAK